MPEQIAPSASPHLRRAAALLCLLPLAFAPGVHAQERESATVTVTGKKERVTKEIDKTIHAVADTPRAANGSAQDVLQATPEVSVTADGQIAVRGNSRVTVLVDGKPTAMLSGSGEERAVALQTMSGADIASVEVITNPSAAHDAGGGAIVNIVLKRKRKPGAHAQLQGSAADHGLWNVGASGDLTRGDLSVHGNLAHRQDGTQKIRRSQVNWNDGAEGRTRQAVQTSEVFVHRNVDSAALGIDYTLSDTDSISLSTRYNRRSSRPLFDVLNENRTDMADTIFHRISEGPNAQSDKSASLAYSRQDGATALKAMVQHSATDALVDKSYRDVFVAPLQETAYSRGATGSGRRLDQATLDWSGATRRGQWGAGLDLQDRVDDIRNYQASVDPATGAETPDVGTTNGYGVRTTLTAAYLTDRLTHGSWEMLLGARAERVALQVDPARGSAHWQAFNPSLHLKHALDDKTALTLAYRRSLQLPDARDLNPFATYVDAQNLSRGNPGLRPQRVSAWEAGVDAAAGSLSGNAGAFYRASRDTVTDARSFSGDVLVTSKQNGGQARSAGITGALDWTAGPALQLGADGGVVRVMLETPDLAGPVRQQGASAYLNVRASWSAGVDKLSLDAHGQSASLTPLGRLGATGSVNLAWKRRLGKTVSLTVNANDIFDGSRRTYATHTATFRQAGFDHFVARRLYVGFVKTLE